MNDEQKTYSAIVWGPEPDSVGERITITAKDLAEAKKKLVARFGEETVYSLWNDEESNRPR